MSQLVISKGESDAAKISLLVELYLIHKQPMKPQLKKCLPFVSRLSLEFISHDLN